MYERFILQLDGKQVEKDLYVNSAAKTAFRRTFVDNRDELIDKVKQRFEGDISLNGTDIANEWFPKKKWDVFISHSHEDENLAIHLASWLKRTFDLETFVDSFVWGSSDDLLKVLDNEYCVLHKNGDKTTYNYNRRNYSTSHVHMMLSGALSEVIFNTECIIFLNTPNSLKVSDLDGQKTNSPWIYNELKISSIVAKIYPRKSLISKRSLQHDGGIYKAIKENLDIDYDITEDLNSFTSLSLGDLLKWEEFHDSSLHSLDTLYFKVMKEI